MDSISCCHFGAPRPVSASIDAGGVSRGKEARHGQTSRDIREGNCQSLNCWVDGSGVLTVLATYASQRSGIHNQLVNKDRTERKFCRLDHRVKSQTVRGGGKLKSCDQVFVAGLARKLEMQLFPFAEAVEPVEVKVGMTKHSRLFQGHQPHLITPGTKVSILNRLQQKLGISPRGRPHTEPPPGPRELKLMDRADVNMAAPSARMVRKQKHRRGKSNPHSKKNDRDKCERLAEPR